MDSKQPPKVSIGLPVYNSEPRIEQALDSVLGQDFQDFELVIADNASTDRTQAICRAYAARDKRIRYFCNETNIGVNPNHDRVFHLSQGTYFTWFADDVEYLPGMLSRCVQAMDAAPPSVVLIYPRCSIIKDGQAITESSQYCIQSEHPRPYKRLEMVIRRVNYVNQFFGLAKRAALAKTQLNGLYASSDYVLLGELALLGEIRELPETLVQRRIDSDRGTAAVIHSEQSWAAWSGAKKNPKKARLSSRERLAVEYLRAAWRAPIQPADKLLCLARILPVYYSRTSERARQALKLVRPWRWK
jgi:glycosyltransferase involved in cell wall biosynthesis